MDLSQAQLKAFTEVARLGSFTKAAAALHLTQSALSHRIKKLEEELEKTLFIRRGGGVQLTADGERLLQFCRMQSHLAEEFLSDWKVENSKSGHLAGTLRIGGTSTLNRSVILPSLGKFLRAHPQVRLELYTRELGELPKLLASGEVDLLVTTKRIDSAALLVEDLGAEENVLVEPARKEFVVPEIYLDHDFEDQTTFDFFQRQKKRPKALQRSFLDDIYGILDGVAEGLGRAVVPLHLCANRKDVRVVKGYVPMPTPVYLISVRQPYYTKIQAAAISELKKHAPAFLRNK